MSLFWWHKRFIPFGEHSRTVHCEHMLFSEQVKKEKRIELTNICWIHFLLCSYIVPESDSDPHNCSSVCINVGLGLMGGGNLSCKSNKKVCKTSQWVPALFFSLYLSEWPCSGWRRVIGKDMKWGGAPPPPPPAPTSLLCKEHVS